MVRINRTYSIDHDIVEKLKKEANVSELINALLVVYFNKTNSKDLKLLRKELDVLDNNIDAQRRERDRKADVIRELENKAQDDNKLILEKEQERVITKDKDKWLEEKVKEKIITFEEYRYIKQLDNWEDCIDALKEDKMDIKELVEKAKELFTKE